MPRIIDNYSLNEGIGEGVYGKVYKAIHIRTKEEFAVKVVPVQRFRENPKLEECTVNEINTLSNIEPSPHIVRYVEMLKTNNNFYFVYEFCNGGTLEKLLKQEGHLPQNKAMEYFKQLVQAFKILFKHNIMHRDIKPDNILFNNGVLKLGDFGFCKNLKTVGDMTATMLGSPIYMAPEVLRGEIYTSKADIWSLGVVLFEMLYGFCPFQSNSIAKLISVLQENQVKFPPSPNVSQQTKNLIKKLLTKDHFKRIDWPGVFSLVGEETPVEVQSQYNPPSVDDRLRVSLGNLPEWDFQKELKKNGGTPTTSNANGNGLSHTGKTNSTSTLERTYDNKETKPSLYENSPNKAGYLSDAALKMNQVKKIASIPNGEAPVDYKRKGLIEEHAFCMQAVRTAVDLLKTEDRQSLAYSYLLLKKCEERLRKMCQTVDLTEIEYQDIIMGITNEIRQVERQLIALRDQMNNGSFDIKQITGDSKRYLQSRFRQTDPNLRLWMEMTTFLFGQKGPAKQLSSLEMSLQIKNKLI